MLKNYLTSIIYFFTIFLTSTLILTIINYFNILNHTIISILKLIIPIISLSISSYILGTNSKQKGYLEGIKLGLIIITIFIITILLFDKLEIKSLLYYLILILISILSSMLGINKKKI